MFVRILRALLGIWAVLVFSITLLFSGILYFIIFSTTPKDKAAHIAHRIVSRAWARILFISFGIRLRVKNKSLLENDKVYVFAANHRSMLDIPAYALACNHTFRFLAKAELMKIPVLGYIIRQLYISVDRKNKAARSKSMENMHRSLQQGISVFICPEGTRNKTENLLLNFHDGAFRLAISAQVPLAVLTILNSGKLLSPKRPIELKPGIIECVWSAPIDTKGMTEDDIPHLKEIVIKLMEKELLASANLRNK
ncbi:MAG: 1-acyl-sn-glycerol-3-phosphate acyltransferase [Bacteroidetes bacterium]|nr:MAG: 1-acyl-sn-glycerol-3-phosphate acyltransferase [Bacteroidota bacterium]